MHEATAPAAGTGASGLRSCAAAAAAVVAGGLILLVPAIVNGTPFVFWDTALYLALGGLIAAPDPTAAIVALQNDPSLLGRAVSGPERDLLLERAASHLGARPVAYAYYLEQASSLASVWFPAFLQCVLVAAVLWAALRIVWGRPVAAWKFLILCAALAALTPLGIAGPMLMPDIFAAPLILLLGILFAAYDDLSLRARAILAVAIVVCVIVHPTHAPIAIVLAILAAAFQLLRTRRAGPGAAPLGWVAGALVAAVAINAGLTSLAESHIGRDLHRPPFLTGRVIDDGPGRAYLEESCPGSTFEICRFAERVLATEDMDGALFGGTSSVAGDDMVWNPAEKGGVYLAEDSGVAERLRDQSLSFALASIAAHPLEQAVASMRNFLRVLVSFRPTAVGSEVSFAYEEYANARDWLGAGVLLERLPNREACAASPSAPCGALPFGPMKLVHYLSVCLAILLIAAAAGRFLLVNGPRITRLDRIDSFVVLVCAGVVTNALVCGVLGGAFDRYQTRVIWMIPALAGALILFSPDKLDLRGALAARRGARA